MRKTLKKANPVSFKKRKIYGYTTPHLRFGSVGLKFDKNYTIERLYIISLKKNFKFFLKKRVNFSKKVWFFLVENTPIFKKGKNARMGKGKGIYQRMAFRVKKNQMFLEFLNINHLFLKKISLFFKKNTNIKNSIFSKTGYHYFNRPINTTFYKIYNRY